MFCIFTGLIGGLRERAGAGDDWAHCERGERGERRRRHEFAFRRAGDIKNCLHGMNFPGRKPRGQRACDGRARQRNGRGSAGRAQPRLLIAEWSRSESLRRPAWRQVELRSVAGRSDGWRRKANNASGPQRKQYNADRRRNKEASAGGASENAAKAVAMMLFVMRRFGTGSALRADDAVMHVESGGRPGK